MRNLVVLCALAAEMSCGLPTVDCSIEPERCLNVPAGLKDAGTFNTASTVDAGSSTQAPTIDAGPAATQHDAGTTPSVDAGPATMPPRDAGSTMHPPRDAGTGGATTTGDDWAWTPGASVGLVSGDGGFVDALMTPDGVAIVTTSGVTIVDARGAPVVGYHSPRPVFAAASDDSYVVVADGAALVALTLPNLTPAAPVWLTETCVDGVMMSKHRFVCGPNEDWDRIFYTYDVPSGVEVSRSAKYTYEGIPMVKVPGADWFVTVTLNLSPSDFYMKRLEGTKATVVSYRDSPYHGDFAASLRFAFVGNPATDLIQEEGHILSMAPDCGGGGYGSTTACFLKHGEIGVLGAKERFIAMTQENDGVHIDGVITTSTDYFNRSCSGSNCTLVRINATTRSITSSMPFTEVLGEYERIDLKFDDANHRLLLLRHPTCTSYSSSCEPYRLSYFQLN